MTRPFALRAILFISAALASACGGDDGPQAVGDTNTNWLKRCDVDAECDGGFSCLCGTCTIACTQDDDCSGLDERAVCTVPARNCPEVIRSCQLPAASPIASATSSSTSASSEPTAPVSTEPAPTEPAPSAEPVPSEPAPSTPATPPSNPPPTMLEGARGEAGWSATPGAGFGSANDVTIGTNGGVFVAGRTQGENDAAPDAFVGWYSPSDGTVLWTDTFGTDGTDEANGVVVDAQGIVVVGSTEGALNETTANEGVSGDAFVVRYSSMGELLWTELITTPDADVATAVALDTAGSILVTGQLGSSATVLPRAFVARYDDREQQWLRELGTTEAGTTIATSIAASPTGDNLAVVGWTQENLGDGAPAGVDAFVAQYTTAGELLWVRQFGTEQVDEAHAVTIDDEGNVYVTGRSYGDLDGPRLGETDAFLAKYSLTGNLEWLVGFGGEVNDDAWGIARDAFGNIFIAGATSGALDGANIGGYDVYLTKFSAAAQVSWTRQFGSEGNDVGYGVVADTDGNVFVAGSTSGNESSFVQRFQ